MQAIFETIFDILYLTSVTAIGIRMVSKGKENKQYLLFGIMAIVLGLGDAFHLVPRAYALCTDGLENHVFALGLGKWITSVTMTIFYVLLYHVWRLRYKVSDQNHWTFLTYGLALVRIVLCMMPQNRWLFADAPLSWAIYRNIPFAILGLIVILLFTQSVKKTQDRTFRHMALTIVLSFGFYLPVVLWADAHPLVGLLMIPKTLAYVWTILIGYLAMNRELKNLK